MITVELYPPPFPPLPSFAPKRGNRAQAGVRKGCGYQVMVLNGVALSLCFSLSLSCTAGVYLDIPFNRFNEGKGEAMNRGGGMPGPNRLD